MYQRRPFLVTMVLAMLVLGLIWGCASDDEDDPNAPPAGPCNLSLVDPVGSETYFSGTLQYILWDSENGGDLVKIELFKFQDQYDTTFMDTTIVSIDTTVVDTTIFVIEDATGNDGSTSWTVTTNGAQSDSNYSIKLTSLTDQGCVARSDTFLIIKTEDCEVFVLVPQDDDHWVVGDSELIQWESEDTGGTVNIDLYKLVIAGATVTRQEWHKVASVIDITARDSVATTAADVTARAALAANTALAAALAAGISCEAHFSKQADMLLTLLEEAITT